MDRMNLFKKTVVDILSLIHYPQNEIEKYSTTLLEHALNHAFLDAAEEISDEDQHEMDKLLKSKKSQKEVMTAFTNFLDMHEYKKIVERNLQEQLFQFAHSVAESTLEPERSAILSLAEQYNTAFIN